MIRESLGCVDLNVTSKCNCTCEYCTACDGNSELSDEIIEKVFDKLIDLQTRFVVISGGEPFLYKNIKRIFDLADEHGQYTVLLTNGILAGNEEVHFVHKEVNVLRLSLDSIEQEKFDRIKGNGTFAKLMYTFDLLKQYNVPINLNMPVALSDPFDVSEIIRFCIGKGVNSIRFSPIIPVLDEQKEYRRLLTNIVKAIISNERNLYFQDFRKIVSLDDFIDDIRSLYCPGGTISLNVNPNGSVTKCAFVKKELGNLNEKNIDEIWFKNYDSCDNIKCEIIDAEVINIVEEVLRKYWNHYAVRKAVSCWYAEIHGKKKMCLRGLPFWTLYFHGDRSL